MKDIFLKKTTDSVYPTAPYASIEEELERYVLKNLQPLTPYDYELRRNGAVLGSGTATTLSTAEGEAFLLLTSEFYEVYEYKHLDLLGNEAQYVESHTVVKNIAGTTGYQLIEADSFAFTPLAPSIGVEVDITNSFKAGGGTANSALFGFKFANGDFFGGEFEAFSGYFRFVFIPNGQPKINMKGVYDSSGIAKEDGAGISVPPAFRVGISISDESLTLWLKEPAKDWAVYGKLKTPDMTLTAGVPYLDFRLPAVLASITHAKVYIASQNTTGTGFTTFNLATRKAGYLHGVGVANFVPVTYSDGGFVEDGGIHALVGGSVAQASSNPSDNPTGIHACHSAIFELNLESYDLKQRAKIFSIRPGADGVDRVRGDNATAPVFDLNTNQWTFIMSSWGSYGVAGEGVKPYLFRSAELPRGVKVFEKGVPMNLPTPFGGFPYDTDHKFINGKWYIVYSTNQEAQYATAQYPSGFGVCLATCDNLEGPYTLVSSTFKSGVIVEGAKLFMIDGIWRILITFGSATGEYKVLDLQCNELGDLHRAPLQYEAGSPGHPAIIGVQKNNRTHFYWLVFGGERFDNAVYSWGHMHVFTINDFVDGYVYPIRPYIN